jgi:hypothetical protein
MGILLLAGYVVLFYWIGSSASKEKEKNETLVIEGALGFLIFFIWLELLLATIYLKLLVDKVKAFKG